METLFITICLCAFYIILFHEDYVPTEEIENNGDTIATVNEGKEAIYGVSTEEIGCPQNCTTNQTEQ